jgi:uncharacterized membrane protein
MTDQNKEELQERIERLERKVQRLEKRLTESRHGAGSKASVSPAGEARKESATSREMADEYEHSWPAENVQLGEQWLNRIGIGLLLFGVAFLFKYTIDQGWLIPPVRSAIGLGIGITLFASGLQMARDKKPLKQILLGGGIAVFYITGFATFQLYTFVPDIIIWLFMLVVTLLALSLSLQQDEAVLSVVGTLGALGTPFMLYTGDGSVISLMLYTALILVTAAGIYLQKGWKTLLWGYVIGGITVMGVAIVNTVYISEDDAMAKLWVMQGGLLLWMGASWLLPVVRTVLSKRNPHRWTVPSMLLADGTIDENINYKPGTDLHLMVFLVPLIGLIFTIGLWEFSMTEAGLSAMVLAVVGGFLFWPLKTVEIVKLSSTHGFLGLVMLTIGFVLLWEGNFLFAVLTTEAVALRYISFQTGDHKISLSSHFLFLLVVLWLFNMFGFSEEAGALMVDVEFVTQLGTIAAVGLLAPRWLRNLDIRQIYQLTAHLLFLVWLYQEFSGLENGQAWISMAWGAYAIILLLMGFLRFGKRMRLTGMATIFVVVGKLFLVDLSQLEAIWRILLFIGFGITFLILGYYWQTRWNKDGSETELSNS